MRIEKLEKDKKKLLKLIEKMPEGRLKINHPTVGYPRYYRLYKDQETNKQIEEFISKRNNIGLAQKLATRSYYKVLIQQIDSEIKLLSEFAATYKPDEKIDVYYRLNKDRRELVIPFYELNDKKAIEWNAITYEGNTKYPIGDDFQTENGLNVRSKSELYIAEYLDKNSDKVFYKYEYPYLVKTSGEVFYPDFTIMNRKTGKIFYLEHCGKMGDPDYVRKMIYKHNRYLDDGLVQGKDLLYTFESVDSPFNTRVFRLMMAENVFK